MFDRNPFLNRVRHALWHQSKPICISFFAGTPAAACSAIEGQGISLARPFPFKFNESLQEDCSLYR